MTDARRDQWGRYKVVPPTGGKPIGYTRATTVAKTLDDGGGLIPWKATLTMVGALRRPGLHARWQALMAEYADPWYASPQSKAACKGLVEECATAGGSTDRADQGTATHAVVQQSTRGGPDLILQPEMRADLDAYHAALAARGIVIDPTTVEAVVVLDEFQVAGTSDNLSIFVPGLGHVVGDLKTGESLEYSGQSIAVQLAIYANANNVYHQGDAADGSEDRRLPMPELNREVGLIIHLPAGSAKCTLHEVDLVAGWEAVERSVWARKWRSNKGLLTPLRKAGPSAAKATAVQAPTSRRGQLQQRCKVVAELNPATAAVMASTWPAGIGKLTEPRAFADDELDALEAHIVGFETAVSAPFAEPVKEQPTENPQPKVEVETPSLPAVTIVEGDEVAEDDPMFVGMKARYVKLDEAGHSWMAQIIGESIAAGRSIHMATGRTTRRVRIVDGLTILSAAGVESFARDLTHLATDCDAVLFDSVPLGAAVSIMSAVEAATFAGLAESLVADPAKFGMRDGHLALQPAA